MDNTYMTGGAHEPSSFERAKPYFGYLGLLVLVTFAYLAIRAYGDTLVAPAPLIGSDSASQQIHVNDFLHVLLALSLVIATARGLGAIFRAIKQPPVVGEMIAGILLGPSLLGHIAPAAFAYILPHSVAPLLNVISQVGVILYMFLVGLDLDVSSLQTRAHATITISHSSIVVPFLLGAGLALVLYPLLSTSDVSFTAFSLFLGVSMSVTAFPVLARILTDRGIHRTKMGTLTLACAAIDDISAWCLLAFVVSVTQSHAGRALPTLLMALGFITLMLLIIRPLILKFTRVIDEKGRLTQGILAFVLLAILLSSLATESIGIHAIFGAFLLGAIVPSGSLLAKDLTGKLEDFVIVFLLPAFFAYTGLRTQIGLVSGARDWLLCLVIIAVASIGKFGGSTVAARLNGLAWRDASALGVLMNTRGLMELIVLNIGLELHVISPVLFAMLVLMALTTTLITTPILHFIMPRRKLEDEADAIASASSMAARTNHRAGTLVPITNAAGIANLLDLALKLTPADAPPPRVLAILRTAAVGVNLMDPSELRPSRSPLLAAALDVAWSRGKVITPTALWTGDAATEIVRAAEAAQVKWLLLESRRSILGRYPHRSVVNKVLTLASGLPINVAVLVQTESIVDGPVTCLVGSPCNASCVIDVAKKIAGQGRARIISVCQDGPDEDVWSDHTIDVITPATAAELLELLPKGTVVIAREVLEEWRLEYEQLTVNRNIIVVQSAEGQAAQLPAFEEVNLQTVIVEATAL